MTINIRELFIGVVLSISGLLMFYFWHSFLSTGFIGLIAISMIIESIDVKPKKSRRRKR